MQSMIKDVNEKTVTQIEIGDLKSEQKKRNIKKEVITSKLSVVIKVLKSKISILESSGEEYMKSRHMAHLKKF